MNTTDFKDALSEITAIAAKVGMRARAPAKLDKYVMLKAPQNGQGFDIQIHGRKLSVTSFIASDEQYKCSEEVYILTIKQEALARQWLNGLM